MTITLRIDCDSRSILDFKEAYFIINHTFGRTYDVVYCQLASVVACAGFYMDVDVDLNTKYAIVCRKTVLIPENDEESTHFAYDSDILSGTIETIMRSKR